MNYNIILKWSITIILFLIGLFCYMKDYGYCEDYSDYCFFNVAPEKEYLFQNYECRGARVTNTKIQSNKQINEWQEAYDNHHFNAVRTYLDAYNRVWCLPDLKWRQIGRDCWIAACGTAGGSNPTARLIIAFSTLLSSYGLHCLDEWDYINDKLFWSQYHFEQCIYYSGLING